MNVIIAYLDTMFRSYPDSPRMAEAKAELQTMMEDAYSGFIASGMSENEAVGKVITEFGNLDELAPVLGITAEINPAATPTTPEPRTPAHPPLTVAEAQSYAETQRAVQPRLAQAVALFIVSPAALIALTTLGSSPSIGFSSQVGSFIGLALLLILVALGVTMAIGYNRSLDRHTRITTGAFSRTPEVDTWADALRGTTESRRTRALQLSVTLWVLAVLPILTVSLLPIISDETENTWSGVAVAGMLVLVATGILIYVPTVWASSATETIMRGGRGDAGTSEGENSLVGVVAAIYWPLLTAIFLGWSFIGNAWDQSWIVWPIGAVLFGAIAGGLSAWERYRTIRRSPQA